MVTCKVTDRNVNTLYPISKAYSGFQKLENKSDVVCIRPPELIYPAFNPNWVLFAGGKLKSVRIQDPGFVSDVKPGWRGLVSDVSSGHKL